MKYFDFHAHIIMKQVFDDIPNIDAHIQPGDVGGIPQACTDLPRIIQTQIHQSQLAAFNEEVIIGAVLYGLESYLAKEVIPLRKFLKGSSQHKLSLQLLNDVVANKCTAFKDFTISRTLDNYLNATSSFNVLSKENINEPLPKNKVNIFFVVEGCHSFVDTMNEVTEDQIFNADEIITNINALQHRVNVLSINLTHMQQSSLCNHAFGAQITNVDPFLPRGNGMSEDGKKVAQAIYDLGIHIDVKHMSYKSRLDLRNDTDAGLFNNPMPLLCTHAGFTGVPFSEYPGYIFLKKPVGNAVYIETAKPLHVENEPLRRGAPTFNMATINLFDEEIVWIVKNKGMIGLSMDRRILGYVDKFDTAPGGVTDGSLIVDKDFIGKFEWNTLGINNNQIGKKITDNNCLTMQDLEANTEEDLQSRNEYFYDHILLHLKHYLAVCLKAGIPLKEAQTHITIGSDFDGLINPFLNLVTVEEMKDLKRYIIANFRFYLESLKDSKEWASQLDVEQFTEDLFYNNGHAFVRSYFRQ